MPAIVLALVLALAGPVARAASAAPDATAITGVVVNGTHGGAVVPNLVVTLQATGGSGTQDVATATTDAQGRFSFADLSNADTSVYAVYTRFQQGFYSTGEITVDNGTQDVRLTVYDATNDPGALRITSATILLRDARPANGLLGVGEFFTFHNSATTAFVGTTAPANGQPMGLLRFGLPLGAANLTLGAGFAGAQTAHVATGFGATATLPPGDSQLAFAFDAPYTGTSCALALAAEYPTDHVLLLAPPPFQLDTHDLAARGSLSSSGAQYDAYTRDALPAGAALRAQVRNLPPAGEPPALDLAQLIALAALLALVLVAFLALYLRRGELAVALRLVSAPEQPGEAALPPAALTAAQRDAERERLLRRLLTLERENSAHRASARQQAARVRAELRVLLAGSTAGEPQSLAGAPQEQPTHAEHHADEAITSRPRSSEPSRMLSGGGR